MQRHSRIDRNNAPVMRRSSLEAFVQKEAGVPLYPMQSAKYQRTLRLKICWRYQDGFAEGLPLRQLKKPASPLKTLQRSSFGFGVILIWLISGSKLSEQGIRRPSNHARRRISLLSLRQFDTDAHNIFLAEILEARFSASLDFRQRRARLLHNLVESIQF